MKTGWYFQYEITTSVEIISISKEDDDGYVHKCFIFSHLKEKCCETVMVHSMINGYGPVNNKEWYKNKT